MINFEYTPLIGYYYQNEPSGVTRLVMDEAEYDFDVYEKRIYLYQVPKAVNRWEFTRLVNEHEGFEELEKNLDIPPDGKLVGFEEIEVGIILILERTVFVQKPKNKRNLKVISYICSTEKQSIYG